MRYLFLLLFLTSCAEQNDIFALNKPKCVNGITYLKVGHVWYEQKDYNKCLTDKEISELDNE